MMSKHCWIQYTMSIIDNKCGVSEVSRQSASQFRVTNIGLRLIDSAATATVYAAQELKLKEFELGSLLNLTLGSCVCVCCEF